MKASESSIVVNEDLIKRFQAKTKPDEFGCLMWIGTKNTTGYGLMRVNNTLYRAHRLAYIIHHGFIPENLSILHLCDKPSCVLIDHLMAGTHAENMRQAAQRGRLKGLKGDLSSSRRYPERRPRGSMNHFSLLNEEKVAEILFYFQYRGYTRNELAKKYGVASRTIFDIIKRKTWIHVPFPTTEILAQQTMSPVNGACPASLASHDEC